MSFQVTAAHFASNVHPNYRRIGLGHLSMIRQMLRDGRQISECQGLIKEHQLSLAKQRAALRAAQREVLA